MNIKEYLKKVESVLRKYPKELRKNYYNNKANLKIVFEERDIFDMLDSYNNETNEIVYVNDNTLTHSLFNMAFRDESKVGQKICSDYEVYYGQGVSMIKYVNDRKVFYQGALNKGFAEYLSRKCCSYKNHELIFYFTNLLISIYGEDMLKYAFLNDPAGLLNDDRFADIINFSTTLDDLDDAIKVILLTSAFNKFMNNILSEDDTKEFASILCTTYIKYKKSLIELFRCITNEYNNASIPCIEKEQFIKMLDDFLTNPVYNIAFGLDGDNVSVRKEVEQIINEFKNIRVKTKR